MICLDLTFPQAAGTITNLQGDLSTNAWTITIDEDELSIYREGVDYLIERFGAHGEGELGGDIFSKIIGNEIVAYINEDREVWKLNPPLSYFHPIAESMRERYHGVDLDKK